MTANIDTIGEHAVVLGASMGGLFAARVLADFHHTVTVVERDVLPVGVANRRGVPACTTTPTPGHIGHWLTRRSPHLFVEADLP